MILSNQSCSLPLNAIVVGGLTVIQSNNHFYPQFVAHKVDKQISLQWVCWLAARMVSIRFGWIQIEFYDNLNWLYGWYLMISSAPKQDNKTHLT